MDVDYATLLLGKQSRECVAECAYGNACVLEEGCLWKESDYFYPDDLRGTLWNVGFR